ncbi:uncharacterized protein LOC112564895 [Pomacea canaliculata]|uniref:uncharacterized protein LOC112564895 n=1 Tax=Pomacea canaliculata TaxID=400727 RepID=UPI000D72DE75|nr:uncharacterized protein LOC112564895 [Pomacea canaliculata]
MYLQLHSYRQCKYFETLGVSVLMLLLGCHGEPLMRADFVLEIGVKQQACGVRSSSASLGALAGFNCNDRYYDVAGTLRDVLRFQSSACQEEGLFHQQRRTNCTAQSLRHLKLFLHYTSDLRYVLPTYVDSIYGAGIVLLQQRLTDLLQGFCRFCHRVAQEEGQEGSACRLPVLHVYALGDNRGYQRRSWEEVNNAGDTPGCICSSQQAFGPLQMTPLLGPHLGSQTYTEDAFSEVLGSLTCSLTQFLEQVRLGEDC